jgi:hypothetical protein
MLARPLMDLHASSDVISWKTDFERRHYGVVLVVVLIVALLHALVLSFLRESVRAGATAARPAVVSLTARMIPPDTAPISSVPAEEKTSSTSVHSAQHAKERRSQMTERQAVRSNPKEQAIGTAAVRQDPAANTEPPSEANAHTSQKSDSNLNWQGDLKRIGKDRATRYEKTSPFDSPTAEVLSPPPVDVLARGVSEAKRGDCRNAHAKAGLLALPMLALGAVSDSGCKW